MAFCASGLATSAHLLISLNHRKGGLNRVRGLNERIPLHKEIDVSLCNGILRIWLGHSAHLLISLNDRMRGLNNRMLVGLGNVLICFNPALAWFPALLNSDR